MGALVTLSLLIYVFAIIFMGGIASYLSSGVHMDEDVKKVALNNWASLADAAVTLLRSITGGGPWGAIVVPLREANELYHILFLVYIAVLSLAIMKLLTGVFVRHAAAACSLDKERCILNSIKDL